MLHALEKSVLVLYIKKGSRILAPYTFTRVFPAFSKKGCPKPLDSNRRKHRKRRKRRKRSYFFRFNIF